MVVSTAISVNADEAFMSAYAEAGQLLDRFGQLLHVARPREQANGALQELGSKLSLTLGKWQNRTFQVAVLALVKSGKSTLINSLLGQEFLPTANTPETARLVRIVHTPGATDGELREASVVQATGATAINTHLRGRNRQVREDDEFRATDDLVLAAPLRALSAQTFGKQRFEILDTPGPNESGTRQLRVRVEALLGEVDVIVYVLDYTKLKTDEEHTLLQTLADLRPELLRSCADRLFFIVNKIDAENRNGLTRAETATYVSELIKRQFPAIAIGPDRVLPVSAELGLLARVIDGADPSPKAQRDFGKIAFGMLREDPPLAECRQHTGEFLKRSGLPAFEHQVLSYIFDHRARLLLQGILGDLDRFLSILDNYLKTAEGVLREDRDELRQKVNGLKEDMAKILAGLQEVEATTARIKREAEAWIRGRFDLFRQEAREAIAVTLDRQADAGFVRRKLSRLLSRARDHLFGDDEVDRVRSRVIEVNNCIEQHLRQEFEDFQLALETEAIDQQRALFSSLQQTIQPLARRIEGRIDHAFNISLAPVLIRLPTPSLGNFQHQIAAYTDAFVASTQRSVPVVKNERYVVSVGWCSKKYAWRQVVGLETITTHAVAVEVLQKLWTDRLNELTETSVKTTKAVIGNVIEEAIARTRQELKAYSDGFLSTIEHEIQRSEEGRSTRDERLVEIANQRANVAALHGHVHDALRRGSAPLRKNEKSGEAAKSLLGAANGAARPHVEGCDVAIVTAIDDETKAILMLLCARGMRYETTQRDERFFYTWSVSSPSGRTVRTVLAQGTGKGSLCAQSVTHDLITHFSPRWVLLVGIAAGFPEREISIGDIIVPSTVFHYEPEKLIRRGSGHRPMPYECAPFVQRAMKHLGVTGELDRLMGPSKVHYKEYASGDKVLASKFAPVRKKILSISLDIAGFEMEGPGVLHAVREAYKDRHFVGSVLKCVSDLGDERMDATKKDGNRKLALDRAAQLLFLLLPHLSNE